jgi:hypothetical protein
MGKAKKGQDKKDNSRYVIIMASHEMIQAALVMLDNQ